MPSINFNLFDIHARKTVHREVTIAPQQLMGVRIMDHTIWWSGIDRQIKGIQGVQVTIHQKIASVTSHFPL